MKEMRKNIRNQSGMTLFEILVVLGIGAVLATTIFIGFTRQNTAQDLDLATVSLAVFLRDAQERARSQNASSQWGVYFENNTTNPDYYALFSGPTFTTATATVYLPNTVEFSNPSSGANKEIVFEKATGLPADAETIILRRVGSPTETRTITVDENGRISY